MATKKRITEKKKMRTYRIKPQTIAQIDTLAKSDGVSQSVIIEEAVDVKYCAVKRCMTGVRK
jgi:hypothetical protein